jgi:hypothetical protein
MLLSNPSCAMLTLSVMCNVFCYFQLQIIGSCVINGFMCVSILFSAVIICNTSMQKYTITIGYCHVYMCEQIISRLLTFSLVYISLQMLLNE